MSILIRQKLVENAKIQKLKCDILSNFQTMCVHERSELQVLAGTLFTFFILTNFTSSKNDSPRSLVSEFEIFYVLYKLILWLFQCRLFMRQQADQECGGSLGKNLFPFAIFDPTCRSRDPRSEVKGHDLYERAATPPDSR